ncbi:MAG: dihydroflavonol-4-reductase [Saprospiraceae bacterium]|jgi:dihydroflavonol-4-reductase
MIKKVLITGADGLLGSNLVRELLARDYKVRVLLLPDSPSTTLDGLDIERYTGNILQPDDLQKAMDGCGYLVHAAANTNIWPNRSSIVRKVNIEGTRNIAEAALKAGIKRMVYIGTANSFGFGPKDHPGDETQAYQSAKYGLDYQDSKYEAQQYLLKQHKENNLPAIIINPTFMLGPYDSKPSAGAMVLAIYNRKVPAFAPGGKNYIYVKDVAVAITNALDGKGRLGECYIAGNENLNFKEAFTKIATITGVKPPGFSLPGGILKLYGRLGSAMGAITGKAPTVSYPMTQISCDEHYFSAQKAVDELGLPQTDVGIAIKEAFNWFKENGYL